MAEDDRPERGRVRTRGPADLWRPPIRWLARRPTRFPTSGATAASAW